MYVSRGDGEGGRCVCVCVWNVRGFGGSGMS